MGSTFYPEPPSEDVMKALEVLSRQLAGMHVAGFEHSAQTDDAFLDGRTVGRAEAGLVLLREAFALTPADKQRLDDAEDEARRLAGAW